MTYDLIVKIRTYNNVSRKGDYYYTRYKDSQGRMRTSQVRTTRMNTEQFIDYVHKAKNLRTAKTKKELIKSYVHPRITKKDLKKIVVKDEVVEKVKDYNLERELSMNSLINDRKSFKSVSQYENDEMRIIIKLGDRNRLSEMSEERFRAKLYSYMNVSSPRGANALFLNDIVNKWGQEFKK